MATICPSCGEPNRDDALMCGMCHAVLRKVGAKLPPEVERALARAKAGIAAEKFDDAKTALHDALRPLPAAEGYGVVLALTRQWSSAMKLPTKQRGPFLALLQRMKTHLEAGQAREAMVAFSAAHELVQTQATDELPLIAFGVEYFVDPSAWPAKQAPAAAPPPPPAKPAPPASAPTPGAGPLDFAAIAAQVGTQNDPFFASFGFLPDFSPASLLVLDAFIDAMWGTDGEAPGQEGWDPPPGKQKVILNFGAYLGETLRRAWSGQWRPDPRGPAWAAVTLPQEGEALPFARVFRRFKNGRTEALFPVYLLVRSHLGPPSGERESYAAHARHLRSHGGPEQAQAVAVELERLAVGSVPAAASGSPVSPQPASPPDFERARRELFGPPFDGVALDGSLASLIAIDAILDRVWGGAEQPKQALDPARWQPTLELLAAYLGGLAVQHFGGKWSHHAQAGWGVLLPGGHGFSPASFVKLRHQVGWSHALWTQLEMARALDAVRARTGKLPEGGIQLMQDDLPPLGERTWTAIGDYGVARAQAGHLEPANRIFSVLTHANLPAVQARGHYFLSVSALQARRFADAIAALDRALALVPGVPAWLENKAVALLELKRFDEARPLLEQVLALEPKKASAAYHLGNSWRDSGKPDEAADWYRRAVELDPGYLDAWNNLSHLLLRAGRHDEALAAADRVIAGRSSDLGPALTNRAHALAALGKPAEALKALERAIEQSGSKTDDLWLERAQLERTLGHNEEALRSLSKLSATPPAAVALRAQLENDPQVLMERANAHGGAGRAEQAIAGYRQVLAVEPSHAEARRQLAIAFAELGQHEQALAEFDALVAAHPEDLTAQDNRATLLVRMGRLEAARAAFDAVLARAPEASTFKRRGFCLASLERLPEALADYVRSVETDPAYAEGWVFRAELEQRLGRTAEAIGSWRSGLAVRDWSKLGPSSRARAHAKLWELENPGRKRQPDAAEPLRQKAFLLAGRQRFAEVLPLLEQALELDPLDAESWHNKGAALLQLGRREQAIAALRRADALDSLPSRAALARLESGGAV